MTTPSVTLPIDLTEVRHLATRESVLISMPPNTETTIYIVQRDALRDTVMVVTTNPGGLLRISDES